MTALSPDAHALSAFRALPNGEGRSYTATWFPGGPWDGVSRFIRMCRAVGWIREGMPSAESYAVLDVLDEDGNIVQDFPIPDARAFQGIKKKLDLRVEAT